MVDIARESRVRAREPPETVEPDIADDDTGIQRGERKRDPYNTISGKHPDHHDGRIFKKYDAKNNRER